MTWQRASITDGREGQRPKGIESSKTPQDEVLRLVRSSDEIQPLRAGIALHVVEELTFANGRRQHERAVSFIATAVPTTLATGRQPEGTFQQRERMELC